ncbi:MAG: secretin N-terminal domain-containing protein [Aureliella sp.]
MEKFEASWSAKWACGALVPLVLVTLLVCPNPLYAQVSFADSQYVSQRGGVSQAAFRGQDSRNTNRGEIELNIEGEISLDALLSYVSKRLGIRFEYTRAIGQRAIVLRAPGAVPVEALPTLLASVLKTESLVLLDSEVDGWKKVVDVEGMASFAPTGQADQVLRQNGPAAPVTQIFLLKRANPTTLSSTLEPFLSGTGSNIAGIADAGVLVVTDYASNVAAVARLIEILDQPGKDSYLQVYEARNQDASELAEQAMKVLGGSSGNSRSGLNIVALSSGNRIAIAGDAQMSEEAMELLRQLDVSRGMLTRVYRLQHIPVERLDKIAQGFVGAAQSYESTLDEDGNLLVLRAPPEVQEKVQRLIEQIDVAVQSEESPIQFYKLKNASAIDVLYSLLALQQAYGIGGVGAAGYQTPLGGGLMPNLGYSPTLNGFPNQGLGIQNGGGNGAFPSTRLPLPPGGNSNTDLSDPMGGNPLQTPTLADGNYGRDSGRGNGLQSGGFAAGGFAAGGVASLPGGARVSADIATNSLIVVAPKNVQEMYAELIESLDQRRPQVLIEAKIIAVDTSDDFSLGVEVSVGDRTGTTRLFKFTSFGLSEVNAETGALQIIPGLGFNGTLVDPDVADVVVRALSSHRRAKVLAAPKLLVNDNSTGKLESVSSVPFASVNASQTVSTTSLGGDQQAGTIITVTPHINEDDHLNLDFDVEFSTFAGTGADGLPPPRQIDRVGSSVTIPNGKTVVVGGLKRISDSDTFTGLPWAEKIPLVRELTSRRDRNHQTTSFFLFIRPMVLRDGRFADLRFLSDEQAAEMCLPTDYPGSFPEMIP